jgi:hypothetical protein
MRKEKKGKRVDNKSEFSTITPQNFSSFKNVRFGKRFRNQEEKTDNISLSYLHSMPSNIHFLNVTNQRNMK